MSGNFDLVSSLLLYCVGLGDAISDRAVLAQAHAGYARICIDINSYALALTHFKSAYDASVADTTSYSSMNACCQLVDSVLRSAVELLDIDALNAFYFNLEATWPNKFPHNEDAQSRLQLWRSQHVFWQFKIKLRSFQRKNRFQKIEELLTQIFIQPLPSSLQEKYTELKARSNYAMNFGPVEVARQLLQELVAPPFSIFEDPRSDWRLSYGNARVAFETCVERTAFELSLPYLAALAQYPRDLPLSPTAVHQLKDYQTLVHVARVYIHQNRWGMALDLLRCCCALVSKQREGIAGSELRAAQYGSSDAEKAFDWLVWVCLWHHSAMGASSPPQNIATIGRLDGRFDSWAAEALFYSEKGKSRGVGDFLRNKRALMSAGAVNPHIQNLLPKYHAIHQDDELLEDISSWLDPMTLVISFTLVVEGLGIVCLDHTGILSAQWILGLPGFGTWDVQRLTSILFTEFENPDAAYCLSKDPDPSHRTRLKDALKALTENLISPIRNVLERTSHLRLCFIPAGALNRVPFSALDFQGQPLCERFAIYQVPSLAILREIALASKSRSGEVHQVSIVGRSHHHESTLSEVALECVTALSKLGPKGRIFSAVNLSNKEFLDICEKDDIVHIATHGEMNYDQPLESHIKLQSDLHVADLRKVDSRARLMFFSACFTALGASTKADDMTGFQATILEIGALAFAGSLWNVSAVASLFFVHFFYAEIANSMSGDDVLLIDLFTRAQRRLRQLRRPEMQMIVKELQDILEAGSDISGIPEDIIRDGKIFFKKIDGLRDDFASPFFWAPFVFVGYA